MIMARCLSFRIRRMYYDQIVNGKKVVELRKDTKFWQKRIKEGDTPEIAVFVCGKDTHRRKITHITHEKPEDVLKHELSEQGKKDVSTEKCFAVWLGEVINTIVVVDVETTGLKAYCHRIIQIGAVKIENEEITDDFLAYMCNPGEKYIITEQFYPSGITADEVRNAPTTENVGTACRAWRSDDDKIWSFNRHFDSKFLEHHDWNILPSHWGGCIMLHAQGTMGVKKWPKLVKAAHCYGIVHEENHRALSDAITAAKILIASNEEARNLMK